MQNRLLLEPVPPLQQLRVVGDQLRDLDDVIGRPDVPVELLDWINRLGFPLDRLPVFAVGLLQLLQRRHGPEVDHLQR